MPTDRCTPASVPDSGRDASQETGPRRAEGARKEKSKKKKKKMKISKRMCCVALAISPKNLLHTAHINNKGSAATDPTF